MVSSIKICIESLVICTCWLNNSIYANTYKLVRMTSIDETLHNDRHRINKEAVATGGWVPSAVERGEVMLCHESDKNGCSRASEAVILVWGLRSNNLSRRSNASSGKPHQFVLALMFDPWKNKQVSIEQNASLHGKLRHVNTELT